jgi:ABC-type bacteriocin/lantibiotic exporter with double-glycine peptidase domain
MFIEAGTNFLMPDFMKKIIDVAIPLGDKRYLLEQMILLLIIFILSAISTVLIEFIFSSIGNKLVLDIKLNMIDSIFKYTGIDIKKNYNKMMTIFINDVFIIEQVLTKKISRIVIDLIMIIVILFYLSLTNFKMTLIIICSYPILIFAQLKFNKSIKKRTRELMMKNDVSNTNVKELINNLYEYIAFNAKGYFVDKYKPTEKDLVEKKIDLNLLFSFNSIFPSFLSSITILIVLGIGAFLVIGNTLTIGELIIFYIYANRVFNPIARIVLFFAEFERAKVSFERLFSIVKVREEK